MEGAAGEFLFNNHSPYPSYLKGMSPHCAMKQEHLNGQEIPVEKCLPDNVAGIQGPHCGLTQQAAQHSTAAHSLPPSGVRMGEGKNSVL